MATIEERAKEAIQKVCDKCMFRKACSTHCNDYNRYVDVCKKALKEQDRIARKEERERCIKAAQDIYCYGRICVVHDICKDHGQCGNKNKFREAMEGGMRMKKIMFNDKYGLTEALLNGKKTQTRRVFNATNADVACIEAGETANIISIYSRYKVGEVVAVAQSYQSIYPNDPCFDWMKKEPGWNNKMFVASGVMPHHIRITNIRVERLQDISEEDCFAEGIYEFRHVYGFKDYNKDEWEHHSTPLGAYAALIDKVSGKGTWDGNPYVFVYEFETVTKHALFKVKH